MSKASDWAATLARADMDRSDIKMLRPPGIVCGDMNASVMDTGGLHFDREIYLSCEQAIALGNWIIATFGDQA